MEGLVEWFEFQVPGKVACAERAVEQLGIELDKFGGRKVLLITDKGIQEAGLLETVRQGMEDSSAEIVGTFDRVPPNSEVKVVQACAEMAEKTGADTLVSVGGGSVIDTAKGCAILMVEGGDLLDHQSAVYMPSGPMPTHIAIPTTAGTGSESTFAAVIADEEQQLKLIFQAPDLAPKLALLDPYMTRTLPPGLTAATGIDAFTHCIEALHSEMHEPICDGLALHGMRMIHEYLPRATRDGEDMEARTYMQIAANMGGIAFANAFVGVVHALAHATGGRFGIPHGIANAIFLPFGLEFNINRDPGLGDPQFCSRVYRQVAEALDLAVAGDDDRTASLKLIEHLREFVSDLGLPQALRDVDVPEDGLEDIAEDAIIDGSMFNNPGEDPEAEEILEVLKRVY